MPEFDVEQYLQQLAASTSCSECKVPLPKLGEKDRYIFISYSHKDYKQVYADLAQLYVSDIPFWYDEGLYSHAGINWDDVVLEKMTDSRCAGIIFYMGKNLFTSRSIQTEIRIALGENGNSDLPKIAKTFFAVNLEGDMPPSAILTTVNFFDMFADVEDKMSAISEWMHTLGRAFPDKPTYLPITAPNHNDRLIANIDTMFGIKPNYNPYAFGDALFRSGSGVIEFKNGCVYDGSFADGVFEGHGKLTWPDGVTYEGEWQNGQRHGKGTFVRPNNLQYVGQWADHLPNGHGVESFADGRKYEGDFVDGEHHGQGTMTWPDGASHIGEWKDGLPNGQGTLIEWDGTRFVCQWVNGKRNGIGSATYSDGIVYEGEWKDNHFHGYGIVTYPDGTVYKGLWESSYPHGQGLKTYPDGSVFEGEWKDGNWHYGTFVRGTDGHKFIGGWGENGSKGQGTYIYPDGASRSGIWDGIILLEGEGVMRNDDGSTYDGQIKNNLPHGIGTLTLPDGTVQSGRFEDGEFIGPVE